MAETLVVACTPDMSTCDHYTTVYESSGASASYSIDVPSGTYGVVAMQDTNGDGDFATPGDQIGIYTIDGSNPAPVTAPATGIDITMITMEGNDPSPAPEVGTISGTVTAAAGEDVVGTAVLACTPDVSVCDYGVAIEISGSSATYTIADVPNGDYAVVAFQDTNGDQELGAGDLFGIYSIDGTNPAVVTAPATGIGITMVTLTAESNGLAPQRLEGVARSLQGRNPLEAALRYLRERASS